MRATVNSPIAIGFHGSRPADRATHLLHCTHSRWRLTQSVSPVIPNASDAGAVGPRRSQVNEGHKRFLRLAREIDLGLGERKFLPSGTSA